MEESTPKNNSSPLRKLSNECGNSFTSLDSGFENSFSPHIQSASTFFDFDKELAEIDRFRTINNQFEEDKNRFNMNNLLVQSVELRESPLLIMLNTVFPSFPDVLRGTNLPGQGLTIEDYGIQLKKTADKFEAECKKMDLYRRLNKIICIGLQLINELVNILT